MKKIFTLCCVAGWLVSGSVLAQPAGNPDMQEAMKALGMLMSIAKAKRTLMQS